MTGLRLQDYGYRFFTIGTETYLCNSKAEKKEGDYSYCMVTNRVGRIINISPAKDGVRDITIYADEVNDTSSENNFIKIIVTTDQKLISEGICKIEIPKATVHPKKIILEKGIELDDKWDVNNLSLEFNYAFNIGYQANPAKWTDEDMEEAIRLAVGKYWSNGPANVADVQNKILASLRKTIDPLASEWEVERVPIKKQWALNSVLKDTEIKIKGLDSGVIIPSNIVYK